MVNAVDCTGLSQAQVNSLVSNGVKYVGRYLSHSSWKGLSAGEALMLKSAGLQIFSIYETNPTKASYFSADKGKSDALDAISLAQSVGQPSGTAIYFTVDYDAQPADYPAVLAYFQAIKSNLSGYQLGAYGSYSVLTFLHDNGIADYYFQTVAWSGGKRCNFLHLYQYQCDKQFAGVNVDFDNLEKDDIGAWGQTPTTQSIVIQRVRALAPNDIRKGPSHTAPYLRDAVVGEEFDVYTIQGTWHCIGGENGESYWIDDAGGGLYWIDNPNLKAAQAATQPVYYVIQPGDTLTKIANDKGTTVTQLIALNGIHNKDAIFASQKLRVR